MAQWYKASLLALEEVRMQVQINARLFSVLIFLFFVLFCFVLFFPFIVFLPSRLFLFILIADPF